MYTFPPLDGIVRVLVSFVGIAFTIIFWPPKSRSFRRRGLDPGFGNIAIWPARIWFLWKGKDIVEDAYLQEKDTPYLLQSLNEDSLVLPPKYLPELRMIPGSKLSASEALVTSVLGQHSGVDVILKDRQHYDIARVNVTRTLPALIPRISEKIDDILSGSLSSATASEYTPVKVKDLLSDLVVRTTLLTFVGPKLCEDKQLQWIVVEFANIVRDMAIYMLFIPKGLRPILRPYLPPTFRMKRLHEQARSILFSKAEVTEGDEKIPTVVDHFVSTSETVDEKEIVAKFLVLMAGALHTTRMSAIHAIIDLCAYSSAIEGLKNEIKRHHPNPSSPWQLEEIHRLKIMDSFMKESQRFNPPNYLSFDRIALETISLQDGTVIPKGTFISMPAGPMAMDPGYYEDPQRFLPTRFCAGENSKGYEFVGTENGNIHWGHGRFTCPGRWHASAVMKVILAKLVTKYDIKFPGDQKERLPNVYLDLIVEPNPKQVLLFKVRK